MASWECVIRDGVLQHMLRKMTQSPSPWDYPMGAAPNPLPHQLCSITDIESARSASPRWRQAIDSTAEWACVRLARFDWGNEVGVPWESFSDYELDRFLQNWTVFGHSWKMAVPINSPHLHMFPIGKLTCADLFALRQQLSHPDNVRIEVEHGKYLLYSPDTWVSPVHRFNNF